MSDTDLTIRFDEDRHEFEPGELLGAECDIVSRSPDDVSNVEWRVFWRTEGKGDEDSAEHADGRESAATSLADRRANRLRFETLLPPSPLSYDGVVVRIRWFVRVHVTFSDGKELETDAEFRLGSAAPTQEVPK